MQLLLLLAVAGLCHCGLARLAAIQTGAAFANAVIAESSLSKTSSVLAIEGTQTSRACGPLAASRTCRTWCTTCFIAPLGLALGPNPTLSKDAGSQQQQQGKK